MASHGKLSRHTIYSIRGKTYKTTWGYSSALYNKYKEKIDTALGGDVLSNKRQMRRLIEDRMESQHMTMKQAGSSILNSETFTTSDERAKRQATKDISELRDALGMKGKFRDVSGKFMKAQDVIEWNKKDKGYDITTWEKGPDGKMVKKQYFAIYNWSPKGKQQRWIISPVH
jgi:hypothetical protein